MRLASSSANATPPLKRLLLILFLAVANAAAIDIEKPPHSYLSRELNDPFTRLIPRLQSGEVALDRSSEKTFLASLLKELGIPASSQTLVFSTTSLQLSLISPRNPRAIYFNESVYVGFIPGGRIEIVSIDPHVGAIFYIFDIPRGEAPFRFDRSNRCMNCHSGEDTAYVPGLVIKSVIPGPTGGSLESFRLLQSGHSIPFEERYGGWHVTGKHSITNHLGNLTGRYVAGSLVKLANNFGANFNPDKFLVQTSDILPHLIHEHQAGFINRATLAAYKLREDPAQLGEQAKILAGYLMFEDEAPLPAGGVEGDPEFKSAFLSQRKTGPAGASLKDFDLQTRLFKHRCSYMIYTPLFQALPAPLKQSIYRRILDSKLEEQGTIAGILRATLPDFPAR